MSQRVTGKLATECPACYGTGHTPAGEPEMEFAFLPEHGRVEVRTILQGSGCLKCYGLGQLVVGCSYDLQLPARISGQQKPVVRHIVTERIDVATLGYIKRRLDEKGIPVWTLPGVGLS